ncbi:MAG: NAD(P)/FAD-dependent oxidoreductase [Bryobacterales bacterium]
MPCSAPVTRAAAVRSPFRVSAVRPDATGFLVEGDGDQQLHAERLILATGGLAPKTGSDGAGFRFAAALGHTILPLRPALVRCSRKTPLGTRLPASASPSRSKPNATGARQAATQEARRAPPRLQRSGHPRCEATI